MSRTSLGKPPLAQIQVQCRVSLTHPPLITATAIALFWRGTNEETRSAHRNRRPDKNQLNDIQGTLGELVYINRLERALGKASIAKDQ